eukprot:COSAG01_NODE_10943_length_2042_cov_2.876480_3_plen_206_part_00
MRPLAGGWAAPPPAAALPARSMKLRDLSRDLLLSVLTARRHEGDTDSVLGVRDLGRLAAVSSAWTHPGPHPESILVAAARLLLRRLRWQDADECANDERAGQRGGLTAWLYALAEHRALLQPLEFTATNPELIALGPGSGSSSSTLKVKGGAAGVGGGARATALAGRALWGTAVCAEARMRSGVHRASFHIGETQGERREILGPQ